MSKKFKIFSFFITITILCTVYYYIYPKNEKLIIKKQNEYMVKNLNASIEQISEIYDNKFIVKENNKFGIIDIEGNIIKENKFDLIIRVYHNSYYLQKDKKGELLNLVSNKSIEINEIEKINSKYFKIMYNNRYGIVDGELNKILDLKYDFITSNKNYIIAFIGENLELYSNSKTLKRLETKNKNIKLGIGEYLYIEKNSKLGILDKNMQELIEPKYDFFLELNDKDILIGYIGNKNYLINLTDKIERKVDYENYGNEVQGKIMVLKNGKIGYIDKKGESIIPTIYDGGFIAQKGVDFFQVKKDNSWVLLDNKGKELLKLNYDDIGRIKEGYILVEKNNKFGFVDTKGNVKIPLEYIVANEFKNGIAIVGQESGFGVIDKNNKVIIPLEYEDLIIKDEQIFVIKDGKAGVLNLSGEKVLPIIYDKLEYIDKNTIFFKIDEESGYLKRKEK